MGRSPGRRTDGPSRGWRPPPRPRLARHLGRGRGRPRRRRVVPGPCRGRRRPTDRAARRHPVHERAGRAAAGRARRPGPPAEALARYEQVRAALANELGTDPGTALRDRHARLLCAEPPARP
ncbi:hypothetical protein B1R27_07370 [Streptomyces sp. GKU 895]|nr:hypothetical protein B1R27_07370 [Streptomyces sp. GKU 895]